MTNKEILTKAIEKAYINNYRFNYRFENVGFNTFQYKIIDIDLEGNVIVWINFLF